MSNGAVNLLRSQYTQMFGWLEGTMEDVTDEIAHAKPGGQVSPIAGQIGHIITGVDFFILGMAAGKEPLMTSTFADKSGISEPQPPGEFGEWAKRVKVDLKAVHEYGKAVFAGVDEYLSTLNDSDLEREVDFGGAGKHPLQWGLNVMILNTYSHTGEISAIKGLQGLKGYPF